MGPPQLGISNGLATPFFRKEGGTGVSPGLIFRRPLGAGISACAPLLPLHRAPLPPFSLPSPGLGALKSEERRVPGELGAARRAAEVAHPWQLPRAALLRVLLQPPASPRAPLRTFLRRNSSGQRFFFFSWDRDRRVLWWQRAAEAAGSFPGKAGGEPGPGAGGCSARWPAAGMRGC